MKKIKVKSGSAKTIMTALNITKAEMKEAEKRLKSIYHEKNKQTRSKGVT
jgi:hypothetical protein